jgi:lipoyl-dependent peroxiredoxin subunit D
VSEKGLRLLLAATNRRQTMSLQTLRDRLPDYAKDLKLSLGTLGTETILSASQKAGTFIASAIASRNAEVIAAVTAEFTPQVDPATVTAAKAAAAIMGMNNVYYRFLHLVEDESYGKLRANLRMNIIANPGVPRTDFELWSLAVSAVNGCGKCITSHERVLREAGLTQEQVQAAVRIAAVIHAIAVTLEAESVAAPEREAVAA